MTNVFSRLISDDTAASLTEYALIMALIAVAAIGALQFLGQGIGGTYNTVSDELSAVTGS
jgi:Flp pilus assembly pilin Flp